MKLYTKPGACSTADHIALVWSGQPFSVQIMTQAELKQPDFLALNPAGSVPVIEDQGFVLTQNAAIMAYIADWAPKSGLYGDGSLQQRGEANRWIAYVNSDVHPAFKPLFAPGAFIADESQYDAVKAAAVKRVQNVYKAADDRLADREWLAGFRSGADAYLYITLRWANALKIDWSQYQNLAHFKARLDRDAGVLQALAAESLSVL